MIARRTIEGVRRGFTIIELLIVIAMVAVLAGVSMGRTSKMVTGWRVNRAAQAMQEEIQAAFALVGRNRKPIILEFRTDSMNLVMRGRPDPTHHDTVVVYRRRNFGKDSEYKLAAGDLTFSTPTANLPSARIEIYPPGLAADSLSILIVKQGNNRRVRMMRGGLVQVCTTGATNKC